MTDLLEEGVRARGTTIREAFNELDLTRQLTDRMPSSDIAVTLMTARHRNQQMRWTGNDIFDIDAMSVAVPYCDIVVTERHMCGELLRHRVHTRAQTTILRDLAGLATIVERDLG